MKKILIENLEIFLQKQLLWCGVMCTVTKEDIEILLTLFSRKGQYDARTGEQVCCLQIWSPIVWQILHLFNTCLYLRKKKVRSNYFIYLSNLLTYLWTSPWRLVFSYFPPKLNIDIYCINMLFICHAVGSSFMFIFYIWKALDIFSLTLCLLTF